MTAVSFNATSGPFGPAQSDTEIWHSLVERYGRMISRVARTYRLGEADVADVSQTVWLLLFQHIDRLRDPERVAGWLRTTARNESLRVARQRAKTTPMADMAALEVEEVAPERPAAGEVHQRNAVLRDSMDRLPRHQRVLLERLMVSDRPRYDEISRELDIPIGSIGPTRARGLRTLRTMCGSVR